MVPPPLSYGVVLFPGFEVLDIAGPLECLNMLAHRPEGAHLTLSILGRSIDAAHPDEPRLVTPCAEPSSPSQPGFAIHSKQLYQPTHTFHNAPPIDVLLIPGGRGTRTLDRLDEEVAFVKRVYPSLHYVLTICTGVAIAASAGILDGHRVTGNKAIWNLLTPTAPRSYWVAKARWVVSANIWTSSGVSAGTDAMLALLACIYPQHSHPDLIQGVVNGMEYNQILSADDDPFAAVFGAEDVPPRA